MKYFKKIASLMLALMLAAAMTISGFAATETTITAPDNDRVYEVYQIFTGDLSEGILSNVKWGTNAKLPEGAESGKLVSEEILDELTAVNSVSDIDKLNVIKKYVDLESTAIGTVSNGNSLSVPTGYYLIKDNGEVGESESYSLYVVEVVGPTTISPKIGTTTSEKKVKDTNDSTKDSTTDWQDSADYDIGDAVPFQLKATIANDYANYSNGYKLTFHDKESNGLSFQKDTVVVKVDGTEIDSSYYEVKTTGLTDGCTFEIHFANLKEIGSVHAGSVITVEYDSTLNENAVIGSVGNPNTSYITYTNNPNDEQAGENGKTPDDTVIVFTYKVVVNKVDKDNNPLEGAGFTLSKKNTAGVYVPVGEEMKFDEDGTTALTTFTWNGLDDGDYRLSETTTPAGYNTIADIEFSITAEHEIESDNPALIELSGTDTRTDVSGIVTFTTSDNKSSLSTDVVNNKGAQLPSTGGMGTTIFYVLGSILVLGTAVLFVVKKRMSVEE